MTLKTILPGRRFRTLALVLTAGTVLAACAERKERVTFNGVFYKAKAKPASDDRQTFSLKVPRVDRGFEGALLAADYEAARYCIKEFGTSELEWFNGPEGDEGTIAVENNTMTFSGRCTTW